MTRGPSDTAFLPGGSGPVSHRSLKEVGRRWEMRRQATASGVQAVCSFG
jgi:hypothetical protein